MSSLCWECQYEHSDCKGDKRVEKTRGDYFSKKLAINYPARIRELKAELDICQAKAYEYDKLYDKHVELNAERNELKAENEKFKEHMQKVIERLENIEKGGAKRAN